MGSIWNGCRRRTRGRIQVLTLSQIESRSMPSPPFHPYCTVSLLSVVLEGIRIPSSYYSNASYDVPVTVSSYNGPTLLFLN